MKTFAAAILVALVAPSTAAAMSPPVPIDQAPAQIARFVPVARAAWPGSPCAGREQYSTITMAELSADGPPSDNPFVVPEAGSDASTCTVYLLPGEATNDPMQICSDLAHEFGHLALGPTFYAATNPQDPAHDPDPKSIMHDDGGSEAFAPCSAAVGGGELTDDAGWHLIDYGYPVDPNLVDCRLGRLHGEAICWSGRSRFRVLAGTHDWAVQRLRSFPRHHRGSRHERRRPRHH